MFDRASFNPVASFQVAQVGDIGMIDSLMGRGFYELLADTGLQPFRDLGIRHVYAALSPAHFRLLRAALKGARVEQQGTCRINGRDIPWVQISDIES